MHQPIAAPAAKSSATPVQESKVIQKCGCEHKSEGGGECESCKKKEGQLQRRATANGQSRGEVPGIVHEVLHSSGQPLDASVRDLMEPRFGHDFSRVRVHTDDRAGASAQSINALAYTSGQHIVFAPGHYSTNSKSGQQLLAHELTHTIQQQSMSHAGPLRIDDTHSAYEQQAHHTAAQVLSGEVKSVQGLTPAAPQISRQNQDAVGYTMRLSGLPRTGVQFFPDNIVDTVVGPVSVRGGLLDGGMNRLSVIVGENMSIRRVAREILPLWMSATPFTPPGAAAALPLDNITDEQLAQALLVYNETYLPVPAMTRWRAGLRLPLPVEVNNTNHVATLHPGQILQLTGGFTAAMTAALDMPAAATVAEPAATVQANATAFLTTHTTALARGIQMGAMALTNSVAALPLIREVFHQLGPNGFDAALEFSDNMVQPEADLLAAQRDGSEIITIILRALTPGPAAPTPAQQDSMDRASLLFLLGGAAAAPPAAAPNLPEKTITIDTLKLDGVTMDPAIAVAEANAIYTQCNVRVVHGRSATANAAQTATMIGNTDLRAGRNVRDLSGEERRLFRDARSIFGLTARYIGIFVHSISGISASGYSSDVPAQTNPLLLNKAMVADDGDTATLAHELGHVLGRVRAHRPTGLMSARGVNPRSPEVANNICTRFYNNAQP